MRSCKGTETSSGDIDRNNLSTRRRYIYERSAFRNAAANRTAAPPLAETGLCDPLPLSRLSLATGFTVGFSVNAAAVVDVKAEKDLVGYWSFDDLDENQKAFEEVQEKAGLLATPTPP